MKCFFTAWLKSNDKGPYVVVAEVMDVWDVLVFDAFDEVEEEFEEWLVEWLEE